MGVALAGRGTREDATDDFKFSLTLTYIGVQESHGYKGQCIWGEYCEAGLLLGESFSGDEIELTVGYIHKMRPPL